MSKKCQRCPDSTTNRDGVCDLCRAEEVQKIADEIEAMLQYDKRAYSEIYTQGPNVIIRVYGS